MIRKTEQSVRLTRKLLIEGKDLVGEAEAPQLQKYDEFVPPRLLRKAFAADCLDTEEMKREVGKWR